MCVYLCMYVLEPCKYAGLRSRWCPVIYDVIVTRPSSFSPSLYLSPWSLHEVYMKFTILRLVEKGKSCVKGRVCCRKPPPIFAIVPQSFEAVSLHQKFYQNHFSLKTLLNPYWKLWYEAGSDDLRRSEKRWFSGGDGRREIYLLLPEQKDAYGSWGNWPREGSRT